MSVVVIPSIGASPRLEGVVLAAMSSAADMVVVLENQSFNGDRHAPSAGHQLSKLISGKLVYQSKPGRSLYGMWNDGMAMAFDTPTQVAVILNDDVEIPVGTINLLIEHIQRSPRLAVLGADYMTPHLDPIPNPSLRYVSGTYRHGGIGGFAFACRSDVCSVDEQFEWWGGDDDLVKSAIQRGYQAAILEGAPVRHPAPETSASLFPELSAAKDRDRQRMQDKWSDPW